MNNIELYLQTKQAQLKEYELKLKALKEKISSSNVEAKSEIDKRIQAVETKIKDGKEKLDAASKASKDEIESHKKAIDDVFMAINTHLAMS